MIYGGLRDKRTSALSAINYFTVELVDHTPPVIDPKTMFWSRIAIFAYPTCILNYR